MKLKPFILLVCALTTATAGLVSAATNDPGALLQKGLFEEEANRDLDAAIQAYQSVITETDKNHRFAATAIFRLGECYRKQGKTNEATAQYQRILREFPDQTELVKLSEAYAGKPASSPSSFQDRLVSVKRGEEFSPDADEIKRIQALIKDSPDLINAYDGLVTPLNLAVNSGRLAVVTFLLANKANIEARDLRNGQTPLISAAEQGNKGMVELLLSHGAEIDAVCQSTPTSQARYRGYTALHLAAERGYKAVVETLLAHGAKIDANAPNLTQETPLHLAATKGYQAVAQLLLDKGSEINAKAVDGTTALHAAVKANNRSIVDLFLAHNADVNTQTTDGTTPLHTAAGAKQLEIAKLLLAHGADINARMRNGTTPFILAAQSGSIDIAKLLLAAKCDVAAKDDNGNTALLMAASWHHNEMAELLLASGADVNARSAQFQSALFWAVEHNSPDLLKTILAYKPVLEVLDNDGLTPLQRAVNRDETNVAALLLDAGADVNAVYKLSENLSPLEVAVRGRKKVMVALLLAHKAEVNWQDRNGKTALDYAKTDAAALPPNQETQKAAEIADLLLKAGADENIQRLSVITVSRGEQKLDIFFKGTNSINHYTLFELVNQLYPPSGAQGWGFPDLNKVTIERLTSPARQKQKIEVALGDLLEAGDCTKDVPLEWGDVVEIPETDHKLSENWRGLSQAAQATLQKCVARTVDISVKGQRQKFVLYPGSGTGGPAYADLPQRSLRPESATPGNSLPPAPKLPSLSSCRLGQVVFGANMILASSDLSRIKVIRTDAVSKKVSEMVFDLRQTDGDNHFRPFPPPTGGDFATRLARLTSAANFPAKAYDPSTDLWLRDGDVIEIPEKP